MKRSSVRGLVPYILVAALAAADNRVFETEQCRCEMPEEHFYTDGTSGYYSKWLFPCDSNGFFIIGEVTIIPKRDSLCSGSTLKSLSTPFLHAFKPSDESKPDTSNSFIRRNLRNRNSQNELGENSLPFANRPDASLQRR